MQKTTQPTKAKDIVREWHLVDVQDKILGRTATYIAKLLMGKEKPYFAKNMDCGDHVVVINAQNVKVTGNKETQKIYTHYSGYSSGLRRERLEEVRAKNPEKIIRHAVHGMLPKNRLRDRMLIRLHVYADATHPYADKFSK